MQIILSKNCRSLTGILSSDCAYAIQRRKSGFFAKRNSRGVVSPRDHWQFILYCAQLTRRRVHIIDIRLSRREFFAALREAGLYHNPRQVKQQTLTASDVFYYQQKWNL